jgi:hypothetical protein
LIYIKGFFISFRRSGFEDVDPEAEVKSHTQIAPENIAPDGLLARL